MIYLNYELRNDGDAMRKFEKPRYFQLTMAVFSAISLSVVLFFAIYRFDAIKAIFSNVFGILEPFIYGSVIAYLLRPMCNWYEDNFSQYFPRKMRKMASGAAVMMSMVSGILIVYALIIMIGPQLIQSITNIWSSLPDRVNSFINWATVTFGEDEELLNFFNTSYETVYQAVDTWVKNTLTPRITDIVSGVGQSVVTVFKTLLNMLIGFIVAIYLLSSRKKFKTQGVMLIRSVFKPRWADMILNEMAFVDRVFGGFIDGKIVDSAIIGVLCYIGCMIFRFPNALLVSAIIGITNVIPFLGPFIGAVPATILILLENPIKGLWFIVFVFGLQQLDGNIIGPKILGDRTGLSSFWVLFAITLFGGLWGLVGMIVGVPIVAVAYDLIRKLIHRGLIRNNGMEYWDAYNSLYAEEEVIPRPDDPEINRGSEIP